MLTLERQQTTKTPKKRRKIKPIRVVILLLFAAAAVYATVCAVQFIGDVYIAMKIKSADTADRTVPTMTDYDLPTEQKKLSELFENEKVKEDQSMLLINTSNLLDEGFEAEVSEYEESGVWMNDCIKDAYKELAKAVSARFEEKLFVSSAYRTAEEQKRQIEEEGDTAQEVGASEHQAGLALDVYIMGYAGMGFLNCDTGVWVNANCWRTGFIIRYPNGKTASTGIEFEPWHIRYTGAPHAEYIMRNGITLEEYFDKLELGVLKKITTEDGDYAVIRFFGDPPKVPKSFKSAIISIDNTGSYIATFEL